MIKNIEKNMRLVTADVDFDADAMSGNNFVAKNNTTQVRNKKLVITTQIIMGMPAELTHAE